MSKVNKKKRKHVASEHEKKLEELVFGKDILDAIVPIDDVKSFIDMGSKAPAWNDDDDDEIDINLDKTDRLKKFKTKNNKNNISGTEFSSVLQKRFQTKPLAWTDDNNICNLDRDNDDYDDNDILRRAGTMVSSQQTSSLYQNQLNTSKIDIARLVDANIDEPSTKAVNTISFHSSGSLMLTAGDDKYLRLFEIDGEKNKKHITVKFPDMPIKVASFLPNNSNAEEGEIVVTGRKPYFYSYDITSGSVRKVNGAMGKNITSHENMCISPSGNVMAIAGGGGYVHVINGRSKMWMGDVKMSCHGVRSLSLMSDTILVCSGVDATICVFDLRIIQSSGSSSAVMSSNLSPKCIHRFRHDDGTSSSTLSTWSNPSSHSQYLAVGAESGVVSVFQEDFSSTLSSNNLTSSLGKMATKDSPRAIRSIMNLTTKITDLTFHSSGHLLAISSQEKKDQFRLVHLPSCTVFSNWPTDKTPLGHVRCTAFSPNGGMLALGNHRGKVLLYRLNQFSTA